VLKDQKVIVQRVEAKSSADLELAQRDIAHLHARIVELQEEKRAGSARCEALGVALADAQAGAARAGSEAAASDSARASSLDAYARLRRWHVRFYQAMSAVFTPFYQSDGGLRPVLRDIAFAPVSRLPGLSKRRGEDHCEARLPAAVGTGPCKRAVTEL
jgi:hypothetical protein